MADPYDPSYYHHIPPIPTREEYEKEGEYPHLTWEIGDMLRSNYTGGYYIPYQLYKRDYTPIWGRTQKDRVMIKLHNIETGETHEMLLSHMNGASFHNVSRGEIAKDPAEALIAAINLHSRDVETNITKPLAAYNYIKEEAVKNHNLTIDVLQKKEIDPVTTIEQQVTVAGEEAEGGVPAQPARGEPPGVEPEAREPPPL